MKRYGRHEVIVTDKLRPYGADIKEIGNAHRHELAGFEQSGGKLTPFASTKAAGDVAFRVNADSAKIRSMTYSVHNIFCLETPLCSRTKFKSLRDAGLREWRDFLVACPLLEREFRRRVRICLAAPHDLLITLQFDRAV